MRLKSIYILLGFCFFLTSPTYANELPFILASPSSTTTYTLNISTPSHQELNIIDFKINASEDNNQCLHDDPSAWPNKVHAHSYCTDYLCYSVTEKPYYISSQIITEALGTELKCMALIYDTGSKVVTKSFGLTYADGFYSAMPSTDSINF